VKHETQKTVVDEGGAEGTGVSVPLPLRSTAVLFRNFGQINGILASLRCRVEYLKLARWQKVLRVGKSADHGIGGRRI
jgi:hypothetical protein